MLKKRIVFIVAAIVLIGGLTALLYANPEEHAGDRRKQDKVQIRAFIYHHFGKQDKYPSTSVSVKQFRQHLAYLKKHDYTVLPLGKALERMDSGQNLPGKTAVLTIDDGYASVWENALPLLDKFGYKATIFVPASHVGGGNYLSWEQVAALQKKGHEIGNHSHSHPYFLNSDAGKIAEAFETDLEKAHDLFRRHLGSVPDIYAYPFGEYHPGMFAVLEKHGYQAAAAQKSGVICPGSEKFALPRFPMNLNYAEMDGFTEKLRMNALPVTGVKPENPVVSGENPPRLRIRVADAGIDPGSLQCFVSGQKNCTVKYSRQNGELVIQARSREPLDFRRTLYTITAPSADGAQWHWYSHLWVLPEIPE